VSQDLTTDSQLIEHGRRWRCVGGRVILWTHRGGVGRDFFQKKHWDYLGGLIGSNIFYCRNFTQWQHHD